MKIKNEHIVEAFTRLDERMQGTDNRPLIFLSVKEVFEMGQFYEWAKPLAKNDDTDPEASTEVPEDLVWVMLKILKM